MIFTIQIRAKGQRRFAPVWKCLNISSMRYQYALFWQEGQEKGFDVRVINSKGEPLSPARLGNIRRMFGLEEGKDVI